jgi:hypothetical protein
VTVGIADSRRETPASRNLPESTNHNRSAVSWLEARRGPAGVLLLLAVVVGTALRFFRLGGRELTIDESLSWAESAGHSAADVMRIQHQLDSGKFPIYELTQHYWMHLFGESAAAMRALSALIGSLSIVLVFVLAIEVMLAASETSEADAADETRVYIVAAMCAFLFAVALPSVEIARQARMYSMTQAWILVQVIFVFRARRLGGLVNYGGIAVSSAIAVATNFTAVLVIVAEGLWIVYLRVAGEGREPDAARESLLMGVALVVAMLLLLPFYAGLRYGVEGVKRGDYDWIKPPGLWEPIATFESGLGSWVFPIFALFAVVGAIGLWRSHRDEAVLLILWLALPPVALLAGSYIVTSMLVTRYVISSFVPLFILSAIGIEYLPQKNYRAVAVVAIVSLSILRVSSDFRPGDNRWRDACQMAVANAGADGRVGVCREYYVVSYYVQVAHGEGVQLVRIPLREVSEPLPGVAIVAPTASPAEIAEIRSQYPKTLGTFKNVVVVARSGTPG